MQEKYLAEEVNDYADCRYKVFSKTRFRHAIGRDNSTTRGTANAATYGKCNKYRKAGYLFFSHAIISRGNAV
jgi:hypothetical protein